MAFDTVISIGGQSLLDGVWRMLLPALQPLNNSLPVTLPGMTNSWVRIRNITPSWSTSPPLSLKLTLDVEVLGDILLTASVKAGIVNLALPNGTLTFPPSALGKLQLPKQNIDITDLKMTGVPAIATTTGNIAISPNSPVNNRLPITDGTLDLSGLEGKVAFVAGNLSDVGLPLPSVVPLALNLTRTPANVVVTLPLSTDPTMGPRSAFGLQLNLGAPAASVISTFRPITIAGQITTALTLLLTQLGVTLPEPQVTPFFEPFKDVGPSRQEIATIAAEIATRAQTAILKVVTDALSDLAVRTGRLIYPPAGAGASCDVMALPTAADVQLVSASDGTPVLQIGFGRTSSTDIPSMPTSAPTTIGDSFLTIGNEFLLELLCCLVERLPGFTLPVARTLPSRNLNVDVRGLLHTLCSNFTGATINIGPITLTGGLSVCIDGATGTTKTITLVGRFAQATGLPPPLTLANITVDFILPLTFDLSDVASVANLRVTGTPTPTVTATVSPNPGLVVLIAAGGILMIGPAVAVVANTLLIAVCETSSRLLNSAVRTVLGVVSLVQSPVAIPTGLFEAFGKLVPITVTIDDLTADTVLQTPTTPWSLPARTSFAPGTQNPDA